VHTASPSQAISNCPIPALRVSVFPLEQEFLRRTRRQKKRTAGHRKVLPKAFGLFTRYASLADPEIALLTEAIEGLDDGLGKPHEQLMLELEIWSKSHRALLSATRKLAKPRP